MWPVCRLALALLGLLALTALGSAQQSQLIFPLPEGAYPHDVAPAPHRKIWYSAQRNGALSILDPSTGQSR
jgi:virginiamycin B lyase